MPDNPQAGRLPPRDPLPDGQLPDGQLRQALRRRALVWLSRREHGRTELERKLLRCPEASAAGEPPLDAVARVLDALQADGWLDDSRAVEVRVRSQSARRGVLHIQADLRQRGLSAPPDQLESLRATELERARALWLRKFGAPPASPANRARQMRFLAGRGFAAEVVWRVVGGGPGRGDTPLDAGDGGDPSEGSDASDISDISASDASDASDAAAG
jgi:regulatory protein